MFFKIARGFRNHPKKIIFFGGVIGLAGNFAKNKYNEECLMRAYCEEALKYGEVTHRLTDTGRHVTVILNPAAADGKGKSKYEKYCAPLLHLAGLKVALVRTEHENQAKQIMEIMDNTSAVIVAGGDGTLAEILTGLLRREDYSAAAKRFPLGILPLGITNSVASSIWGFKDTPEVKHLAEATMAIIREVKRPLDVMEITPYEGNVPASKPVYAAAEIEWGAFRDAKDKKSTYWYWAFLKKYMVYVFSSYKDFAWNCAADVEYKFPCSGCAKCKAEEEKQKFEEAQNKPKRWWHAFLPRNKSNVEEEQIDYSKIINEDCGRTESLEVDRISDIKISTSNMSHCNSIPGYSFSLKLGEVDLGAFSFIKEGWKREFTGIASHDKEFIVGELVLWPKDTSLTDKKGEDRKLSIDSEPFEVRPMRIKPIPNAVTIFALPKVVIPL